MRPTVVLVAAASWFAAGFGLPAQASGALSPVVLTLDQAVAGAIDASPDLRALVIQENAALDTFRLGARDLFPKVGLNFSQNQNVQVDAQDTQSTQVGLTLTQPIFDAGRGARQRELAKFQLASSRQDYTLQEQKLADSVRTLFNQILVLKQKKDIQDQVVQLAEKQLAISRAEFKLGSAREIDVLDTEAQVSSLKVDKKQSERSLKDALYQLADLLGLDPRVSVDVVGTFDAEYTGLAVPESSERWLALVLDSSKDLAQQTLELRKQYFQLLDSNLWFLPNITLEATVSLSGAPLPLQTPAFNGKLTFSFPTSAFPISESTSLGGTPGQSRTAAITGNIGLLDSVQGFIDSGAAAANYRLTQVKEGVLRATTRYQFEKTLGDYRLLVEKLALQRNTVDMEQRKNAIVAKQLELGEAKRLDYLQGESQLAKDRISLIESVLQIKESERTLETLMHLAPGDLARAAAEEGR